MIRQINFLESRFNYLSPFSAHQIKVGDEIFSTVEHAYQAARIEPGPERDAIKNATSPLEAWREGQKYKNNLGLAVDNFDKYLVMKNLFRLKIDQHPDIREILLESVGSELLKVSDYDSYWGTGSDGKGQNKMGQLWMELRAELI